MNTKFNGLSLFALILICSFMYNTLQDDLEYVGKLTITKS